MRNNGGLIAILLLASACASSSTQSVARKATPEKTYDCNYETKTGSNIPELVCRSEKQKQEERAISEQQMRMMQVPVQPIRN